jgi:type IV secretion system protein VirD4
MNAKTKKLLLMNLPYLFVALFAAKLGQVWRLAAGADASAKVLHLMDGFVAAFASPRPSFHPADPGLGVILAAALRLVVYIKGRNAKRFRKNVEYGSARWGKAEDIKPYIDPVFENNVILTQTERLTMNSRPKDPKTARNKNVLIVGGSGSGKTRFFIKPNLMQCDSKDYPTSFVVTDPKGSIIVECGKLLRRRGYRIKILNTINFKKSMHYNPFSYIHSEKDILKLVTTLISNTKGEGKSGDDFWVKAETLLYTALIGYIHYEAPVEEQNFATLIEFINTSEVREDDEEFKNPVDLMFEELAKEKPNHFAVRQYKKYKLAAGKTAKSILISCGARLAPFDIQELRDLTAYDELELDTLGDKNKNDDRKSALFLIMSDTDSTFNFLISMIYSQLFNLLCEKADDVYDGKLPVHVRCLIDEAANIGQIPNLEKLVATIRSREISACLVLQAQSQLKAIYKDNADTIIGNMDSRIFLGGAEPTTLKELSSALGKETIDTFNTGESRGREKSHSLNYSKLGKDLASVDELAVLDGGKCILQLRGVRPFLSDKYDITKHPNYKYLSDYDPRNAFNIEKFLSTQLKPKPDEVYDVYEVDESEPSTTA